MTEGRSAFTNTRSGTARKASHPAALQRLAAACNTRRSSRVHLCALGRALQRSSRSTSVPPTDSGALARRRGRGREASVMRYRAGTSRRSPISNIITSARAAELGWNAGRIWKSSRAKITKSCLLLPAFRSKVANAEESGRRRRLDGTPGSTRTNTFCHIKVYIQSAGCGSGLIKAIS